MGARVLRHLCTSTSRRTNGRRSWCLPVGPSTNSMSVDLTTDASTPRRDGRAASHLPYGTSSCTCTTLGVSATLIMVHTVRAQAGDKKS